MNNAKLLNHKINKPTGLFIHTTQFVESLKLTATATTIACQSIWNKVSHSKTLVLCLLVAILMTGTAIWNQASDYYKSLALVIFQNQRLTQENQQQLHTTLQIWQKAASLQPNSDVLKSEIEQLLPYPTSRN